MKIKLPFILFFSLFSLNVVALDLPDLKPFIDEMVEKHHFNQAQLTQLFAQVEHQPQIINAISSPATQKPWFEYRAAFINSHRITLGLRFWQHYHSTLQRAEKNYGVPAEIIVAVIGVETLYSKQMGNYRVIDALSTLAFDYPRRADFFRSELEAYLLLAREQAWNPLLIKGSYAGAMGIPQFMPSSYRAYAVDFNRNGKIALRSEVQDAIGSVGNYLQHYGWRSGELITQKLHLPADAPAPLNDWQMNGDPEVAAVIDFTLADGKEYWYAFNNFRVITRYNNSYFYAMSIFQLAEALRANYTPAKATLN